MHIIDINASSLSAVLKPAGLDNSKGVISVGYVKDPADPEWKDDEGTKRYLAFMAKYYPDGDRDLNLNVYGYITAQLLVQVLKKCGDDLTRENVMKQASPTHQRRTRSVAARDHGDDYALGLPRQQTVSDGAL